jgi:uncharacterized protein YbjT (DUF2867 family)
MIRTVDGLAAPNGGSGRDGYRGRVKALVTGATGYVGSRLVTALADAGFEVVATARNPDKLKTFDWVDRDEVQTAALDVLDEESVRAALTQAGPIDVAYYLVHALGEGDYESSDAKAAHTFVDEAGQAGVRRIVYLGGFVPADGKVSEHLQSRDEVGEILRSGSVDTVILRAAVILGAGSTSFEIIRHLVGRLPVVPLPAFMRHEVQPIAIDDVLHYLVASADPAVLPAEAYDIAGDEQVTYADLARIYAEVAGLRRWFIPLGWVPERIAALVMGPLIPVPTDLVTDLVQSLATSMISEDPTIKVHIPDPPGGLTSLHEAISRALQPAEDRHGDTSDASPGVDELDDPMTLAETDADWAGTQT